MNCAANRYVELFMEIRFNEELPHFTEDPEFLGGKLVSESGRALAYRFPDKSELVGLVSESANIEFFVVSRQTSLELVGCLRKNQES